MKLQERKETVAKAKELYRNTFNSLSVELRTELAAPHDRLLEIDMAIAQGDNLCMAYLKKRRLELENWLIKWYQGYI